MSVLDIEDFYTILPSHDMSAAALPSCLMVDDWPYQCQEDTVSVLSGDLFAMAKKTADQAEPTWRLLLLLLLLWLSSFVLVFVHLWCVIRSNNC